MRDAEVRFAEHDGIYLAFTVFGEGPVDVAVSQARFPIDLMWDLPQLAGFMEPSAVWRGSSRGTQEVGEHPIR